MSLSGPMRMRPMRASVMLAAACCVVAAPSVGAQTVTRWLVLGPISASAPAFSTGTDSAMLDANAIALDRRWPAAGDSVAWLDGRTYRWSASDAIPTPGSAAVVFAAAYLEADRWQKARLTLAPGARAWLDGARTRGGSLQLTQGKHWLLIARAAGDSTSTARIESTTPLASGAISTDPVRAPSWRDLAAIPEVRDIRVDPRGRRVAWVVRRTDEPNDRWTGRVEVRDVATGALVAQLDPAAEASIPRWSSDGERLAYVTPTDRTGKSGRDLWVWSAKDGTSRVLRDEPGLSSVEWSPDGAWLYFTASARADAFVPAKPGEARRYTDVWERWPYWADKAQLFALDARRGTRVRLAGDSVSSITGATLSPDGSRIIFSKSVRTAARPFIRAEAWVLDLRARTTRKVFELSREIFESPSTYAWSPDGRAVAFCASTRESYEGDEKRFNVFNNGLYGARLDGGALVPLSTGFAPAVGSGLSCPVLHWSAKDGRIYTSADVGARTLPARTTRAVASSLTPTTPVTLETMPIPGEVMSSFDFGGGWLVAAVETPTTPASVYRVALADGKATLLHRPAESSLAQLAMPGWKAWSFRNSRGEEIEGWYWTPPNFDATKKYPMIVHYYGGTLPMKKSFQKRLLWYAANGYVVMMTNPGGTPGYGQKFADYHTDDWGFPAGSDIIEGAQAFEKANAWIDPARVGNFGHSYGGFMTMHLATRTTMFATSVSIAGISNIADYWGAGGTGYSYTEGTCPGCYPWNRPDVFVERSPLFQADRITKPMLLIHGTDDTNVVPTESEQMFTALRMLDRPVELVRVEGENHGINSRPSIEHRLDAMMLEWFDRWLRGRSDAWTYRWSPAATTANNAATATSSSR